MKITNLQPVSRRKNASAGRCYYCGSYDTVPYGGGRYCNVCGKVSF